MDVEKVISDPSPISDAEVGTFVAARFEPRTLTEGRRQQVSFLLVGSICGDLHRGGISPVVEPAVDRPEQGGYTYRCDVLAALRSAELDRLLIRKRITEHLMKDAQAQYIER